MVRSSCIVSKAYASVWSLSARTLSVSAMPEKSHFIFLGKGTVSRTFFLSVKPWYTLVGRFCRVALFSSQDVIKSSILAFNSLIIFLCMCPCVWCGCIHVYMTACILTPWCICGDERRECRVY